MTFGQLIEYSITSIFVKKLYTKYAGKAIARASSTKSKFSISLDQ